MTSNNYDQSCADVFPSRGTHIPFIIQPDRKYSARQDLEYQYPVYKYMKKECECVGNCNCVSPVDKELFQHAEMIKKKNTLLSRKHELEEQLRKVNDELRYY